MAEYISREGAIERIQPHVKPTSVYGEGYMQAIEHAVEILSLMPATDVQPVDTKEILRHLDSMMICISNAYNTSHFLLESDMKFIEKQEKIIKELLSGMKGEENG